MRASASQMGLHGLTAAKRAAVLGLFGILFGCMDNETVGPVLVEGSTRSQVEVDVTSFGARGDDDINDTNAFGAAIRALPAEGGKVSIPSGVFLLSASSGSSIRVHRAIDFFQLANITLAGEGTGQTILRMAPGGSYGGATDVILVARSSGITIRDLTIDGNRGSVTYVDEQSHGVEVWSSSNVRFERVLFTGMHGDGVRLIGVGRAGDPWTDQVWVEDCRFASDGRSGIAVQRGVRGLRVFRSTFTRISDQSIDMEPTGGFPGSDLGPRDFEISGNHFFDTAPLAVTIAGLTTEDPARNIVFTDNQLDDTGIFVFNAQDVRIERNVIRSGSTWRPIALVKASERVWIVDNEIDGRAAAGSAIGLEFHTSRAPKYVYVIDNTIQTGSNGGFYARDSEGLQITGNTFSGNGVVGVIVEDILAGSPLHDFLFEDNTIDGYQVGFSVSSGGDKMTGVCIRSNTLSTGAQAVSTLGPIGLGCDL